MQADLARDDSRCLDPDSGEKRCEEFLDQPPKEFGEPVGVACGVP